MDKHNHSNKWSSVGQVAIPIGSNVLVVIGKICGVCGYTKADMTKIDITDILPKVKKKKKK